MLRVIQVVVDHGLELLRTTFTRSHNKFEGSLTGVIAAFPRNSTTARKLGLKNDGEWTDVPPLENTLTFEDAIKAVNKKRTAERRDTSEGSTDLSDMGEETQLHITRGGMQNTVSVDLADEMKAIDTSV
jgi:S1-C subfamily serine protease